MTAIISWRGWHSALLGLVCAVCHAKPITFRPYVLRTERLEAEKKINKQVIDKLRWDGGLMQEMC